MKQTQPIYAPLIQQIRRRVTDGSLTPGEMIGTEIEFGKRTRISRKSVRVGIDKLVAEGLIERRAGKGIFVRHQKATRVVEIVLPGLTGIWVDVARGAQMSGREHGVKVHIFNAQLDFESDLDAVRQLSKTSVDGAIIGSWHQPRLSRAVAELHQSGFPLVFVDQRLDGLDIPSVVPDNHAIGYKAGQELLRRGHRRIGFVGYVSATSGRERLDGLRDAVNDAGVPFDRSLVMDLPLGGLASHRDSNEWAKALRLLLDPQNHSAHRTGATAIVLHQGEAAGIIYPLIRSMGLRIPTDVSIVGTGTPETAAFLDPTLAVVDLRAQEMGGAAMEMLIKRVNDKQALVEHRVVPSRWIEGGSIAEAARA